MSTNKKWETENIIDFIDDVQFCDHNSEIETNVLIREEAQYLAKNLINKKNLKDLSKKMKDSDNELVNSKDIENLNLNLDTNNYLLSKIEDKLNNYKNFGFEKDIYDVNDDQESSNISNDSSQNDDQLNDIKNTLIQNNLNLEKTFSSFENFMNNALEKMDSILNKKSSQNYSEPIFVEEHSTKLDGVEEIKWDECIGEEFETSNNDERLESLNSLINEQSNFASKQEELARQLDVLKDNIEHLNNINELQYGTLSEKHSLDIHELQNEMNLFRNKFENLNLEINKIYSIWTENNSLLNNLEKLLIELNGKNDELLIDREVYIEELHNKTIDNEKYINELLIQNEDLKHQFSNFSKQIDNISEFKDSLLDSVDEKISKNNSLIDEQLKQEFNSLREEMKDISIQTVESELSKRNLLHLENILKQEKIVDTVLSSEVFNFALESKLNNILSNDQNNVLMKNIHNGFDLYKNQIIDQITESDRIRNIISIEANNLVNLLKTDVTEKINDTKEYMYQKNFALNERIVDLEHKINNISLDEKEIYDMISSSEEIENIINDKLIFIINEKLNTIQDDISFINRKLEEDLKEYVDNNLKNRVVSEVVNSDKMRHIKNETLQSVYSELLKRDEKISFHGEEILKNYETLLENNRILENLEKLVIKQVEEVDGFRKDKEDSIDLIMEKISDQKANIIDLQNKIQDVISGEHLIGNKSIDGVEGIDKDIYENIKLMTLNLVKEEIKKLNLINKDDASKVEPIFANQNDEPESDFFKNRIQDILSKLNQSYEPLDVKKDLVDLNIKMDDLKKESDDSNANDDFSWFYEQELKNHKEEKNIAKQIGEKDNEIKFSYENIDYEELRNSTENDYINHNDFNRRK